MTTEFVHLHVHSQYSLLDSAIRLKELVEQVKSMGMRAVALTDHGNMFGAVQLTTLCKEHDVSPILGCEVNLVSVDRKDPKEHPHHLVLLVRSQEGYHNLVRLVSQAWVDGVVRGVPRIDLNLLRQHSRGLVGLSACMGGYVAQQVLQKGPEAGRTTLLELREIFEPDAFFVELQDHGLIEQGPLNKILVDLAKKLNLPLVATNDCHFLQQSDAKTQLVLQCIAGGLSIEEMLRIHPNSEAMYLKSPAEMTRVFSGVEEALRNTLRIAEMCAGTASPLAAPKLPRFAVPEGHTEESYLRSLSRSGLEKRFEEFSAMNRTISADDYRKRLEMECDVICSMGFAGYFLIVQDFINWGKQNGVPVGPGRGSGAGSIVSYALRITDLDPMQYGLLFERFLNPERVSMPDFDVDFCMQGRDRVIDYVRNKYGTTSVGQIATFHLLKSRSVVRDVGRAMNMTVQESGRIAQLVPEPVQGKSVSIEKALEQEARLKNVYEENPQIKELLDTAMGLEELTRHAGMHAAGVVISEGPLWDHVPVFCPEPETYVTQYHKDDVESAGLVKFDFLGLKTLTVIDIATRLIHRRPDPSGEPFSIERIPLDDPATYALLQSGETTNVFQLESSGMQSLFKQLRPDCFEDIVAAVALYRPGPLGSGMVEDFVQRKHGRVRVAYPHRCLENILKETYGVIVYQEQVMQAAQEMAGYTLGGADLLRRAMGKKKAEEMEKQKSIFVEGSLKKGHNAEDAAKVFELIAYFAGYGFNKSHSAAYALITYQTAYLKAHYPVEFICATLTADKEKIEKVVRTIAEAKSMGITVLAPDVNESAIDFTVVYDAEADAQKPQPLLHQPVCLAGKLRDPLHPKIRFGLGAIKGVGTAAVDAIFEARRLPDAEQQTPNQTREPFTDLFDFISRVDLRRVNKAVVESLVQSGAFDAVHQSFNADRATVFATIESAFEQGRKFQMDRQRGQTQLFGLLESTESRPQGKGRFSSAEPWDQKQILEREKTCLGFYVSGHPLERYAAELRRFCSCTTADVPNQTESSRITLGGMVEGYRERNTRTGGKMAFFDLEDPYGRVEVIVRPKILEANRQTLQAGEPVLITGVVQRESERGAAAYEEDTLEVKMESKLLVEEISLLSHSLHAKTRWVKIRLAAETTPLQKLSDLRGLFQKHKGSCPVDIELVSSEGWVARFKRVATIEPTENLRSVLEKMFGSNVLELGLPLQAAAHASTQPCRETKPAGAPLEIQA